MDHSHTGRGSRQTGQRFEWLADAGPGLRVRFDFCPAVLVAKLSGRLARSSKEHLRAAFRQALSNQPERLVVDTGDLAGSDRDGVAALLDALGTAVPEALPIAISSPASEVRRVVEEISIRQNLTIQAFRSLDEAITTLLSLPGAPLPDQEILLAQVRNLHRALLTRAAIEQTKGILMTVYGLDPEAAFALLVWHARNARIPVRELATRFVSAARQQPLASLTPLETDTLLTDLAIELRHVIEQ